MISCSWKSWNARCLKTRTKNNNKEGEITISQTRLFREVEQKKRAVRWKVSGERLRSLCRESSSRIKRMLDCRPVITSKFFLQICLKIITTQRIKSINYKSQGSSLQTRQGTNMFWKAALTLSLKMFRSVEPGEESFIITMLPRDRSSMFPSFWNVGRWLPWDDYNFPYSLGPCDFLLFQKSKRWPWMLSKYTDLQDAFKNKINV